jgi:hypothetical protein
MAAFVGLGVLAWTTLSDERIRLMTLGILALFAIKTWMRRNDVMHPDGEAEEVPAEAEAGEVLPKANG